MNNKIEYFCCPICGMSKVLNKKIKGRIEFNINFENNGIIQIRESGGYKSGFVIIERIGVKEALKKEEYKEIVENLTAQVEKLYNYLKKEMKNG